MKPRYLLDEHIDPVIQRQLLRINSEIEVVRIADGAALPAGLLDPEILLWAGKNGYILVTEDRSTMSIHLKDHLNQGLSFSGLLWIRPNVGISRIVAELLLIWQASEAEEYEGKAVFIPF